MDTLVFKLVNQQETCKALEDQLQKLEPKRRRAVRADPNEKFVQIEQIMKVKEQAAKHAGKRNNKRKITYPSSLESKRWNTRLICMCLRKCV